MSITQIYNTDDSILLMCSPDQYAIPAPDPEAGHANDFAIRGYEEYLKDPVAFRNLAIKQWKDLRRIFNALGVPVHELESHADMPDLVFTADPTLSMITVSASEAANANPELITILSRFSNEQRQNEVLHNLSCINTHFSGRRIVEAPYNTEGTGDNVYDPFRDVFWSGYVAQAGRMNMASGRSDERAHKVLTSLTGVPVISMPVKKPFFHIDTSMTPLPMGHILCFEDGMQPEAFQKILTEGLDRFGLPREEYLIKVSKEDAAQYACNLRSVGDNTLLMPLISDELRDRLVSKGYEVIQSDMSQFIHSGGAMHCVTNNLNEKRIISGTCHQYGFGPAPRLAAE